MHSLGDESEGEVLEEEERKNKVRKIMMIMDVSIVSAGTSSE